MQTLNSLAIACLLLLTVNCSAEDWRQWRGPTGDHHAPAGATAPTVWGESKGLAWATPIPGRGHSSPTLVGDRIYLTTADTAAQTQSLLIFDRGAGKLIREVVAHRGGLTAQLHPNNTHASPTVASDGQRVFTLFCNGTAAWLTAFDLAGEQLWQQRAIGFDPQRYQFGFGSSPVVIDDLVIVTSEYDGPESGLVALDTATGEVRWRAKRPQQLSYSTPGRLHTNGGVQLLMSGNYELASFDAATGQQRWATSGSTQATCGTMVSDPQLGMAFASGGYPNNFTLGMRLGGEHEIVWQNSVKCYEQSLLLVNGYVYGVADSGVAYCWRATDGEEMWKERLGGSFSSSPLLVDGKIYVTNEAGKTHVFPANPDQFELLAVNQLGTDAFPTPTPGDGRLYHRFGKTEGGTRQEYLVAIGQ